MRTNIISILEFRKVYVNMDNKSNKKVQEAAALKYSPDENEVPEIVALGKGDTAEKILKKAKDNNIPLYENAELAHALNKLNIGDEITPELYEIVAEILVFVADVDSEYAKISRGEE